jgi:hypothetical protein
MKIELRLLSEVKPYAGNPRCNDDAVPAVAASIREFGFRQPIVVDETGVIIVGHTRYKAALSLGLRKVPVHVAKGLTPEQTKAYRLADNQTNRLSDWDTDRLVAELIDLQRVDFDLDLLGFAADQVAALLEPGIGHGLTDPDAVRGGPSTSGAVMPSSGSNSTRCSHAKTTWATMNGASTAGAKGRPISSSDRPTP